MAGPQLSAETVDRPVGYLELVRKNRDFRFLWLGQIVSLLGDWFNLIASASLITLLTQSGLAVGGLFVVRMLAPFLISPLAGVVTDRYDRRRLLILTDLLRAVTVMGFLLVRRPQDVWLLYSLTAVQLAISGVFFPARNAILPDIVEERELGTANALTSATWSVMLAVGAALGGLVAGGWGIYPAFVIDAATFLLSAGLIAQVAYRAEGILEAEGAQLRQAVQQYVGGLRYLWQHPAIFALALSKAAMGLTVSGSFEVFQVAIAEGVFRIGQAGSLSLGLLYMTVGIGTGLGPIVARRFTGDRPQALRRSLPISFAIASLGLFTISPLVSFPVVILGTIGRAVGAGVNWVMSTQLLLITVPSKVRGRVFASEFAFFTLAAAASAGGAGWLLDSPLGLSGSLRLIAALALVPAGVWTGWLLWGPKPASLTPPPEPGPAAEALAAGPPSSPDARG